MCFLIDTAIKKEKNTERKIEREGKNDMEKQIKKNALLYLFLWSWAGGILRILQSDWFRERVVFSYLLTTVMVTNYAKRRVKLRIEGAKFQFVLIVFFFFCNRAVLLFNFKRNFPQYKNIPVLFILLYICWHVDEAMSKIKTWLFQFFWIVSPTC